MQLPDHEHEWLTYRGAEMMQHLGLSNGNSAIDFGCGKGRYTIPLSQALGRNGNVIAIERDTTEIDHLQKRISTFPTQAKIAPIHTSDISLESIQGDTIDAFLAFDVLQYIEDWPRLFNAAHRVLRKTGSLHIYPAAIPHPGAVDVQQLCNVLASTNFKSKTHREFTMMHNKHMINDTVYSFQPSQSANNKGLT